MPQISVIMPVYNSEKTLDRSIGSVLKQTEKDYELIVVNDGSTDKSLEKIEELLDNSNVSHKIITKENGGPSSARSLGLKNASGEFVTLIDSDDMIDKDFLEKTKKVLLETNSNICSARYAFHLDMPILGAIPIKNARRDKFYDTAISKEIVPATNVLVNGKLYRRGYTYITDKRFDANEDLSANYYNYAIAKRLSFANDTTYHYMPNSEGLVSKYIFGYGWEQMKNTFLPLSESKRLFENCGIDGIFHDEVEELFIKNVLERVEFIKSNVKNKEDKEALIQILFDYVTYHYPNWKNNPYLLKHFSNLELPDMFRTVKSAGIIRKYEPTEYPDEESIFKEYQKVSANITQKGSKKSLW